MMCNSMIQEMLKQEEEHLSKMQDLIPSRRVRPSALLPIWNIAGFVLGKPGNFLRLMRAKAS